MTAPTLTEFLLARIAEDEAGAREAFAGAKGIDRSWGGRHLSNEEFEAKWSAMPPDMSGPAADSEHGYCLIGDGRVLAECEAKRRMVEDHNTIHAGCPGSPTLTSDDGEQDGTYGGPCAVLRNLASVYADHPDYDEAWRP